MKVCATKWSKRQVGSVVAPTCCAVCLGLMWALTTYTQSHHRGSVRTRRSLEGGAEENCSAQGEPDVLAAAEEGGLLAMALNFAVVLYLFNLLANVCDGYLVPSIKIMSDRLGLSDDVAGATLMAAGVSCPDLFINLVGTFLTGGDLGVGTVVGCGVLNMSAVPGLCALMSAAPGGVLLEAWPLTRDALAYSAAVASLGVALADGSVSPAETVAMLALYAVYIAVLSWDKALRRKWRCFSTTRQSHVEEGTDRPLLPKRREFIVECADEPSGEYRSKFQQLVTWPSDGSTLERLRWLLSWPGEVVLALTVPDCRAPHLAPLYPLTFFMCVAWIGVASYTVAWTITVVGYILHVPDSLMGLTFIAIGMSVPQVTSSVIVSKQGDGSMALSNSLGSNTFDILLCLGLPWLIKASFFSDSGAVEINSKSLGYSSVLLLAVLALLYTAVAVNMFTLTRTVGVLCLVLYFCFVLLSILLEMDFFFVSNLPECSISQL